MRLSLFAFLVVCAFSQKRPIQSGPVRFAPFDAVRLQQQVESARSAVQRLLNSTKNPTFPTDVPHVYEDKYLLVEFLTNTEIAAQLNSLEALGLSQFSLHALSDWSSDASRSVDLVFAGTKSCTFLRSAAYEGNTTERNTTAQVAMTQYVWSASVNWRIFAVNGPSETVVQQRNINFEFKTPTNQPPTMCANDLTKVMVDVSWIFAHTTNFSIDRAAPSTFTPRRNEAVDTALESLRRLYEWSARVESSLVTKLFVFQGNMPAISAGLFVPVVPVLDGNVHQCQAKANCSATTALSDVEMHALLQEQALSLQNATKLLEAKFPPPSSHSVVSSAEANTVMLLGHIRQLAQAYADGVASVEAVLQAQLVAAIGKVVKPTDIVAFMEFNNQLLFKPEFKPQDISTTIRRPNRDPDGVLSIERVDLASSPPLKAFTRELNNTIPISMPIGGGVTLTLNGKRYLHGAVLHQFSDQHAPRLQFNARSLQFGSFVLVVGTLVSEDEFFAEAACVISNKDRLIMPLLLRLVPNSIAFREAIASLSAEQQAFVRRFHEMQLSSTVFSFVIVQVKPLLEQALRLPPDSLTKEVILVPILTQLIADYQVATDQLAWDGQNVNATNEEKIAAVTAQASSIALLLQQIEANVTAKQNYVIQPLSQDYDYDDAASGSPFAAPPSADDGKRNGGMAPKEPKPQILIPNDPTHAAASTSSAANNSAVAAVPDTPEISDDDLISLLMLSPNSASNSQQQQRAVTSGVVPSLDFNTTSTPSASQEDVMHIPQALSEQFGLLDQQRASGLVTIRPGPAWSQTVHTGLLATPQKISLSSNEQSILRSTAMDLLYALTKAGALEVEADVHAVFATTHAFDSSLLETVIQGNDNPVAVLERINLILAATIHNRSIAEIVAPEQLARTRAENPDLF